MEADIANIASAINTTGTSGIQNDITNGKNAIEANRIAGKEKLAALGDNADEQKKIDEQAKFQNARLDVLKVQGFINSLNQAQSGGSYLGAGSTPLDSFSTGSNYKNDYKYIGNKAKVNSMVEADLKILEASLKNMDPTYANQIKQSIEDTRKQLKAKIGN
jgi:hypothetical protein